MNKQLQYHHRSNPPHGLFYGLLFIALTSLSLIHTAYATDLLAGNIMTWEWIPTSGANTIFPVGIEVCNIGSVTDTNIHGEFSWTETNTVFATPTNYLTTIYLPMSLTPGDCGYLEFYVERTGSLAGTSRGFAVTLHSDNSDEIELSASMILYTFEGSRHIYSPASSRTNMFVGSIYTFSMSYLTANAGPNDKVAMMSFMAPFPNYQVQILSASTNCSDGNIINVPWIEWLNQCTVYDHTAHTCNGREVGNSPFTGLTPMGFSTTGTLKYQVTPIQGFATRSITPYFWWGGTNNGNQETYGISTSTGSFNIAATFPLIFTKTTTSVTWFNAEQEYQIILTYTLSNIGDQTLQNVQIVDDLSNSFVFKTAYFASTTVTITSGSLVANGNYDGATNTNLLSGTVSLGVGSSSTLTMTARVANWPDDNSDAGTYDSKATASYKGESQGTYYSTKNSTVVLSAVPSLNWSFDKRVMGEGSTDCATQSVKQLDITSELLPYTLTYCYFITNNEVSTSLTNVVIEDNGGDSSVPASNFTVNFPNIAPGATSIQTYNLIVTEEETITNSAEAFVTPSGGSFSYSPKTSFATASAIGVLIIKKSATITGWSNSAQTYTINFNISLVLSEPQTNVTTTDDLTEMFAALGGSFTVKNVAGTYANFNFNGKSVKTIVNKRDITVSTYVTFDVVLSGLTSADSGLYSNIARTTFNPNRVTSSNVFVISITVPQVFPLGFEKTVMQAGGSCSKSSVSRLTVLSGTNITYCYRVTNNDPNYNLLQSEITITDNNHTPDDVTDDFNVVITSGVPAGSTVYFTHTYTPYVTSVQTLTNTATVSLLPSIDFRDLMDSSSASIYVKLSSDASISIDIITNDVVGIVTSNPDNGPATYPIAARITNTGVSTALNVIATLGWVTGNSYISTTGVTFVELGDLPVGGVTFAWFNIAVTRSASSANQQREYRITGSGDNFVDTVNQKYSNGNDRRILVRSQTTGFATAAITSNPTTLAATVGFSYNLVTAISSLGGNRGTAQFFYTLPTDIFKKTTVTMTGSTTVDSEFEDFCTFNPITFVCEGTGKYSGGLSQTLTMTPIKAAASTSYSIQLYGLNTQGSSELQQYAANAGSITISVTDPLSATMTLSNLTWIADANEYYVEYEIAISNTGSISLQQIQITNDLLNTFPSFTASMIDRVTVTGGTPNPNFDGTSNTLVLQGTNTIGAGGSLTVTIGFYLVNFGPGDEGNYTNTASVCFTGDVEYCKDASTTDDFPAQIPYDFTVEKTRRILSWNNTAEDYRVQYEIVIDNIGTTTMNSVTCTDDLELTFPSFASTKIERVSASVTGGQVNGNYDGITDIDLLAGDNFIDPGDNITITIDFYIVNFEDVDSGNYTNTATMCFSEYCRNATTTDSFDAKPIYSWTFHKGIEFANGTCSIASPTTKTVTAGTTIKYCYVVVNGEIEPSSVDIVDDNGTPNDPSDDINVSIGTVPPFSTASTSFEKTYELPTTVTNVARARIIPPLLAYRGLQKDANATLTVEDPYTNETCPCDPVTSGKCLDPELPFANTCSGRLCNFGYVCNVLSGAQLCGLHLVEIYVTNEPFNVGDTGIVCNSSIVVMPYLL